MPNLPSNDEITRFDGTDLIFKTLKKYSSRDTILLKPHLRLGLSAV